MSRNPIVVAAALALLPGCFPGEYAFLDAEDTRMDPVRSYHSRAADDGVYGDVYVLSLQGAHEVNGWVGGSIETLGRAFELLSQHALLGRSRDGWEVYGPYPDWQKRDLSWLFKLRGDATVGEFEAYVGPRAADNADEMEMMLAGHVEISDEARFGGFLLDFDVIERHDEMLMDHDREKVHAGTIEVAFERDLETERKIVDIDYDEFSVTMDYPVPEYFAAEKYEFRRHVDGGGEFHVDLSTTFQTQLWSGPEVEDMTLDLEWNDDGAGRARGQVVDSAHGGDNVYGDLIIDECFANDGFLTWREISDGYAQAFPDYSFGDEEACVRHEQPPAQ